MSKSLKMSKKKSQMDYMLFASGFWSIFWQKKATISSLNFHRLCILSIHTFWYIYMPDVTACYGTSSDFIVFFWKLNAKFDDYSYLKCCIDIKLSLIMCLINKSSLVLLICQMWLQIMEGSLIESHF